jgi:branched-chain amino acid transport system substrate-binding protein
LSRVAVVADLRDPSAAAEADAFSSAARRYKVVPEDWPTRDPKDRPDLVKRLAAAKPAAVYLAGAVEDVLTLRGELAKAGVEAAVPVLLGAAASASAVVLADRANAEALYLATAYPESDDSALWPEFAERYRQWFNQPADGVSAAGYDSARVLFEGARRAGSLQAAKLRPGLAELRDFAGLTGPLSFGPDHTARCTAFIVQIRSGTGQVVTRLDGGD